jgi:hypothetical protein
MLRRTWMHSPRQGSLRERAYIHLCKNKRPDNLWLAVRSSEGRQLSRRRADRAAERSGNGGVTVAGGS